MPTMRLRSSVLIVVSLLCLFLLREWATASTDSEQVRLRVSIRNDALKSVPSCQHQFSQVELLNLHSTEAIMIHSIQTAPEETVLVSSSKTSRIGESWEDDAVPQQLHISRLPQGSLSLGPGQVAIVPLTFLPRFPFLGEDDNPYSARFSTITEGSPPPMSPTEREDLANLVGFDALENPERYHESTFPKRRNDLERYLVRSGDEYRVSTTIVVDTSRGVVNMPITATSIRGNGYGLPDTIRFYHPDALRLETSVGGRKNGGVDDSETGEGWRVRPIASTSKAGIFLIDTMYATERPGKPTVRQSHNSKLRDCMDLYLNNPSRDFDLEISEIMISRPELMSVEFDPTKVDWEPDMAPIKSGPSQVIREFTQEGAMYLPVESEDNYVATVCTSQGGVRADESSGLYLEEMANWIDTGSPDRSLGFLQIRTDVETLFVGLERRNQTTSSTASRRRRTDTTGNSTTARKGSSLFQASPDRVNLQLTSSESSQNALNVSLHNKSPVPIRIMRMTVGVEDDNTGRASIAKQIGFKIDIKILPENTTASSANSTNTEPFVLPSASKVVDALRVSCSLDFQTGLSSLSADSLHFEGSIIIRGTMDTELSYQQWRKELLANPFRDSHLVLEIPYAVTIHNGRVELAIERSTHPYSKAWQHQSWDVTGRVISSLFFPRFQLEVSSEAGDRCPVDHYFRGATEISHDLRVISNMAFPIIAKGVTVYDENLDNPGEGSPCRLFNVSLAEPPKEFERYDSFEDIGFLNLLFKFDDPKRSNGQKRSSKDLSRDRETSHGPTKCFLNIETQPAYKGGHMTPILVYDGQLDVGLSPTSPVASQTSATSATIGATPVQSAAVGFDELLSWFSSAQAGKALQKYLQIAGDVRSSKMARSLAKFLLNICSKVPNLEKSTMRPILVKAGAVYSDGGIVSIPVYMSNSNPVPITVSGEVTEVEGMSISLARDESEGPGDGFNILDLIPNWDRGLKDKVSTGVFNGHPVDGLLHFLHRSQYSLDFSRHVRFRDAVWPAQGALASAGTFQKLFRQFASADFHASRVGPTPSHETSACGGDLVPSEYDFANRTLSSRDQSQSRAVLVTNDGFLSKDLSVCKDRATGTSSLGHGTRVCIPPGGIARFVVRFRAMPGNTISNDIAQVVLGGLVLSTNHGDIMPVLVAFDALQGEMLVSHMPSVTAKNPRCEASNSASSGNERSDRVISVPIHFLWGNRTRRESQPQTAIAIAPHEIARKLAHTDGLLPHISTARHGVTIFMKSSFARDVQLLALQSCNPWFEFIFRNSTTPLPYDMDLGINVGALLSAVDCYPESQNGTPSFPTYHQCALQWLKMRQSLQPLGCGLQPSLDKTFSSTGSFVSTRYIIERAKSASQRVLRILSVAHDAGGAFVSEELAQRARMTPVTAARLQLRDSAAIKSGSRKRDGWVAPVVLDAFAEAWEAWKDASTYGLNVISTSLVATLREEKFYDESSDAEKMSFPLPNIAVESTLSAPRLFDCGRALKRAPRAFVPSGDEPAFVEFPSTLVGTVVTLNIPLRNPTSVPVLVRIAAAPSWIGKLDEDADGVRMMYNINSGTRGRFALNYSAPYVQNGKKNKFVNEKAERLWWDGGGAFFSADDRGDVIRSHQNITIRAGTGAHVALVNPSLHANVGFLVGCGVRCGIRDDPQLNKGADALVDPKLTSPIGASAAVGISLMGKRRSTSPQANLVDTEESNVQAGGSPLPGGGGGPAAFAIPFSALDEIVIPPFGEAEIGPLFFRPPGRSRVLGCDLTRESGARHWGAATASLCEARRFSSMILLENSLTGLERLVLEGKGLWEHVYFVDPVKHEEEDFGDIELREGRPTLMFSGSSDGTIVKEVVLHNGGDVIVDFSRVYLSGSQLSTERSMSELTDRCREGSFRIQGCRDISMESEIVPETSVGDGFILKPGENRSIFIEHYPDCTKMQEFVSLNVEFRRENPSRGFVPILDRGLLALSSSGEIRSSKANEWRRSFRKRKIDMLVGYDMNAVAFRSCVAHDRLMARTNRSYFHRKISTSNTTDFAEAKRSNRAQRAQLYSPLVVVICFSIVLLSLVVGRHVTIRMISSDKFRFSMRTPKKKDGNASDAAVAGLNHSNWQSAFRCLARADPTATELHTLGQSQIRQVILNSYNSIGASPPQCFTSSGLFAREPWTKSAGGSHQRTEKDGGNPQSDRKRTISDSIFLPATQILHDPLGQFLPSGIGWSPAATRGIINAQSVEAYRVRLKSSEVLEKRQTGSSKVARSPTAIRERSGGSSSRSRPEVSPQQGTVATAVDTIGSGERSNAKASLAESGFRKVADLNGKLQERKEVVEDVAPAASQNGSNARNMRSQRTRKGASQGAATETAAPTPPVKTATNTNAQVARGQPRSNGKSQVEQVEPATQLKPQRAQKPATHTDSKPARREKVVPGKKTKQNPVKTKPAPSSNTGKKNARIGRSTSPAPFAQTDSNEKIDTGPSVPRSVTTRSASVSTLGSDESGLRRDSSDLMPSHDVGATEESPRGPPGLTPPPGFGSTSPPPSPSPQPRAAEHVAGLGPMLSAALSSERGDMGNSIGLSFSRVVGGNDSSLLASGSLHESRPSILQNTEFGGMGLHESTHLATLEEIPGLSDSATPSLVPADPMVPLIGRDSSGDTDGFDVMDFLDSILNESQQVGNDQGLLGHIPPSTSSSMPGVSVPTISANPWATEPSNPTADSLILGGGPSRAAAYGISFDEKEEGSNNDEDSDHQHAILGVDTVPSSDLPLLTPAAILSVAMDQSGDDQDLPDSSFYESFIAANPSGLSQDHDHQS